MKKITTIIIMAAVLLCSCKDPMDSPEYTTTTTEKPVIGTVTTTSGATEASTEITAEITDEGFVIPENMMFIETGYWAQYEIIGNYLCCEARNNLNLAYEDQTSLLKFYNLDTGTLENTINLPDKTKIYAIYKGEDDVLCRCILEKIISDKGGRYSEHSAAVIYTDFTCKIKDELTELETSIKQGGHYIAHSGKDLIDVKEGHVLVEGYREEEDLYGLESLTPSYAFPIDDNRFVYHMLGYESIPGFGFYDFETATNTLIPDSENYRPIGYHDGKIYSVKTVWDGFPTGVYATDTETLETIAVIDESLVSDGREYTDFFIHPEGEYILIFREWYENEDYKSRRNAFFKADINSGEIISEQEIPAELLPYRGIMKFIDGSRFLIASDLNERGFVIINI